MAERVNWGGRVLEHLPEAWASARRAFFYGDLLFETVRVFGGQLPLWPRHWARLQGGLAQLGFELRTDWDAAFFEKQVLLVAPPNARVRLAIWREAGGYFAPDGDTAQFAVIAEPLSSGIWEWLAEGLRLEVSTSVRLPVDAYSNLKTLNAARYVAAAREARSRQVDDVLICNAFGRVCEATSSNVFWWEGDRLCTVPLSEGCVAGVSRALVLETAAIMGYDVLEKAIHSEELEVADEIFLTNVVRGIQPVRIFAGRLLCSERTRLLFERVCQQVMPA